MDELKALIQEQGKAWAEYRKTNDERLAKLEKGQSTAELDQKLARIDADIAATARAIEDFKAKSDKERLGGGADTSKALDEFTAWARASKNAKGEFKSSLTTQYDPGAGFTVVPEFERMIDRIAGLNGVFRRLATVTPIGSESFKQLVNKGGANGGWADELEDVLETDTPSLAKIEIVANKMHAMPVASNEMLDDSFFDIAAWLAEEIGIAFGELESSAFINGTGVKQPFGILKYPTVINDDYEWGKVGYVASGKDGGFATTNPSDALINLVHALKSKYRNNGSFLLADTTLATIRKFKDGQGNYLWQPGLTADAQDTLLGKPVLTDDFMPAIASDALAIAFGDFKAAYRIIDRSGIKVLSDVYTTKGAVKYYTTKRVGGAVKNFEAYKLMKFAAS